MERQRRKADIEKGLQFIQSTLPLKQEEYEAFLLKLVQNLFAEGNDLFREKDYKQALVQYMEGLNVADYAASDQVALPRELLCKLHVNRAACYFTMGLYEKALEDSEKALGLDSENIRALFRKARALTELGRHKEAYACSSRCSLALPHDESVTQLGQELAQKLGLRVRKAYKRPQELETFSLLSNGTAAGVADQGTSNGLGSIDDIETDCYVDLRGSPAPLPSTPMMPLFPHVLDLLAPLDSSSRALPGTESLDDFSDGDVFGPELDTLLDSLSLVQGGLPGGGVPSELPQLIPVFPGGTPLLPPVVGGSIPVSSPLPPASFGLVVDPSKKLAASVLDALEPPGSGLDSLDLLPYSETRLDALDSFGSPRGSLDKPSSFLGQVTPASSRPEDANSQDHRPPSGTQKPAPSPEPSMPNTALLIKNPLAATHEFKQACQLCYPKTGPRAGDYTYREGLEHKCKRDTLLGRLRSAEDQTWKRIRPRPTKTSFVGSYYLCKDMINKQDCKYGDNCTFAYHQEEIDVWTEERKGTLNRDLLFDPLGGVKRGSLTIAKLLKEHQGIFTFLCEICFDSKPRIISKGTKDSPSVCSNLAAKHSFYNNKCLVHIVRSTSLKYSKVRQFQEHFQFDVCRHEVRYGCLREDSCHFAHSFIELKVWLLQQYSGMTHEDIVQESKKYWQQMEAHTGKASSSLQGAPRTHGPSTFDLQMKFVCGQCWRNGQVVEPDKDLKYCSAKARHCWTKERRVLLVMSKAKRKWVSVRPLPSIRNFPQQYDLCIHAQNGRKCQYVGNCSFAHSPEERDMWTFMKENKILDMQQTYDMWLKKHNPGKPGEGTPVGSREGEKQIQMPTDYADIMMGYHCWLCGKNSNSKKQWQQHIQSEKHKEKVFTSDSDASGWAYRFPMGEFRLCDRLQKGKACPDGDKCRCAHGQEELNEWLDRREVLKQKLAKARKDMLLCPRDDDFGKYNFLLQEDGNTPGAAPEAPATAASTGD
ncbi:zinc finger CCCH domain-containing protein 7B isoform X1 [Cervus elaphus]|uniref:zinc finger CCCH domain-containing protein 7B isoform X1 n=1 Tax=Cervus canadensis TaxID=1574408 RepID=UPI001CA34CEB|nr:zinc finger CCCH domain-containing protein 7B isoform X1 [Cervus canadensis]XP_043296207.1 zinc finger CCCH domain-containing protein 7B isoform X1 [Cervus canadensis]XP_043296208.1 zinc finger CCCH domain-containing protein 7B isoform X1 [Cervus canadensis]XP_043737128.1 zinc finger CCCH domain-containing protein 7B isoform X1 [Cervus elaphus]XP_043737129.1 zinc finger CCCH domain-containing protein 7B isoform X1 [Cervus elaphus]XP_043737130.1 zinc finger CCCH domain-containing protein 7B 